MQVNAAILFGLASAYVTQEKHFLGHENHHVAVSHGDDVPPVSTTMKAVINLTIQFFLVYTGVAIVRTYNDLNKANKLTKALDVLNACTHTVNFAPMLSVLFVGVRMRALQLSKGKPDDVGLPQWWVKDAMLYCAWSVLAQTLMVLAVGIMMDGTPECDEDGTPAAPKGDGMVPKVLTAVRYTAMAVTYGGFTTVVVGAFMMDPPKELWPEGPPPVSPAVGSTMNLSAQYFFVYLGLCVCKTYQDFMGKSDFLTTLGKTFKLGENTVQFAPMLCILFIGARMRALQMDPVNGNPQRWAQICFYACAYSVLVQLCLIFVVPFVLGGSVKHEKGAPDGDVSFELPAGNDMTLKILLGIRWAVMLGLYGGFTAVIVSVHTIEHPDGADKTPAISPAMQCVMNLTVQYFFVYLLLWVAITAKQFVDSMKSMCNATIEVATCMQKTVFFAPMLSVLFIGLRMRALQITDQKGAPQGWAQQGMFLATYAIMFQVLMIAILGLVQGPPKTDEEGNPIAEGSGAAAYGLVAFRYLALLCLYGGAVTCVVALFKITPETATGTGSLIHPMVDVPPPPGVPVMF